MERPELDAWMHKADEVLRDESLVLEGLKKAVEGGWMTQEELEENMQAYHDARTCPDIQGRDL